MAEEHGSRRLAVIVAADIAGYSRLVSRDERETVDALRSLRSEFIDPTIGKYRGRLANTAGDSLLLEFPSVVDATEFAIALQRGMAVRNANIADNQRIDFRIGINLGDVFEQTGDLLGEGVNIAARLETIAPPREICVENRQGRTGLARRCFVQGSGATEVKEHSAPDPGLLAIGARLPSSEEHKRIRPERPN